ncbi:head-tail adaptor protein [Butyrivibrio sp. WCD2001]|uniref:head-tail adaptor protein n=1 Tax=Butyrivibrio sp. WCD2001 TaxID=1280681 RepID=UPI000479F20F|nr:head-tail adaptor protein [Butyrivibrio sp. WCD2001]
MNISNLNERILIQKSDVSSDEIGNQVEVWKDYYSCRAYCSDNPQGGSNGDESSMSFETLAHPIITFSVRYSKKASSVDSENFRIVFQDEVYEIVSVDHMNYMKKLIKYRCRRQRNGKLRED